MLQHRAIFSSRPWHSLCLASRPGQSTTDGKCSLVKTLATMSGNDETARKPSSILSRLSDRTRSSVRHGSDSEGVDVRATASGTPRIRATSFISTRSAQKRDHAAKKWFTDVRELDINNMSQSTEPPHKRRTGSDFPKQHEMRPKTDLRALFSSPTVRSAASRLQAKKELGGDYASYLPDGSVDPHRFPMAYAHLILGRNKHIPLSAQTGALNIVEKAIQGKVTRQAV